MANDDMKEGRFLRWAVARRKLAWIRQCVSSGHTVFMTTYTHSVKIGMKQVDMLRATKTGLYVQRTKRWDNCDGCEITAVAIKGNAMTRAQTIDLFPETQGQILSEEWASDAKDKWGYPLVTVRLIPKWDEKEGWQVGWLARAGNALDEWHPNSPDAHKSMSGYPWYRLDTLPSSKERNVALAVAGRAVKIVLAQMMPYVEPAIHTEVTRIQESVEAQSRAWLQ